MIAQALPAKYMGVNTGRVTGSWPPRGPFGPCGRFERAMMNWLATRSIGPIVNRLPATALGQVQVAATGRRSRPRSGRGLSRCCESSYDRVWRFDWKCNSLSRAAVLAFNSALLASPITWIIMLVGTGKPD